MSDLIHSKSTADRGVPNREAMKHLSEDEKKALELQEHAEHQTGAPREHLQRQAAQKTS